MLVLRLTQPRLVSIPIRTGLLNSFSSVD